MPIYLQCLFPFPKALKKELEVNKAVCTLGPPQTPLLPLSANLKPIAWNFLIHSGTTGRLRALSYLGERLLASSTEPLHS